MTRIAVVALCVGALGLLACGAVRGDSVDAAIIDFTDADTSQIDAASVDAAIIDFTDADTSQIDAGSTTACDPVAGTGCAATEKCTWIVDAVDPNYLAHTGCTANGTAANGAACTSDELGSDDCVAGNYCLNSACTKICSGDSCGADFGCWIYSALFDDRDEVGLCYPVCDPVAQDCNADTEGCYVKATTGEASCAGIPAGAAGVVQDDDCYGPASGGCYLNGCDKGFGANQPDDTCAFFCNPTDNWKDNATSLVGDPSGITCAADFGEVRPAGPGLAFECRYLQTFYSNSQLVAATTGLCVSPGKTPTIDWGAYGTCADFDWVRLQADIADETASQNGYCDSICPECCMVECISQATWDAAFPEKRGRFNYACFSQQKRIRDQFCDRR